MESKQSFLEKLIKEGEGEKIEFKQKISDFYKISKTITSLANRSGGTILVGVKDNKTLITIDPEEEKYMLNEAATFYCSPPIPLKFEEIDDEESQKTILLVHISESTNKPHACKTSQGWRVYIRQNDKSTLASELNISIMQKGILENKKKDFPAIEIPLIYFLKKNKRITLKQYMHLVNISKRRAQRILTDLVLSGVIKVFDHEKEDYYTF